MAWRYACTLQALAALVQPDAAQALLHRAVREYLNDLRSTRAKIDLLQDAALVWPTRLDRCQRQLEHWERLGREVLNAGGRAEFGLYQQAFMETSLSDPPERSGPISWELARDATILFFAERREADLTRITILVLFWRGNDRQVAGWPAGPQLDLLLKWLNVYPASGKPQGRAAAIEFYPRGHSAAEPGWQQHPLGTAIHVGRKAICRRGPDPGRLRAATR